MLLRGADVLQEPLVSLIFNPSAVRDGYPCCHAYWSSRDGCDLIVGIANGEGKQQTRCAVSHGRLAVAVVALNNCKFRHGEAGKYALSECI